MRSLQRVLVSGGAGFIGSNFIRYLLEEETEFRGAVVNVDKLTYAGNLDNLAGVERRFGGERYFFEQADIVDIEAMASILRRYEIDTVVHFAAESHVDRSIFGPREFIQTNIVGTFSLLEAARAVWQGRDGVLFHHVSTDEVFGTLGRFGAFRETTPYAPRSPYSASKAASDHLVRAAHHTYGLPVTVSNCSNNYGPRQFPEKLIPLMILNTLEEKPLPVYGDGRNVRDWLYVDDHSRAIWRILADGRVGETYAVGGEQGWRNIDLVRLLCRRVAELAGMDPRAAEGRISYVGDRPGHDRRYAIRCTKIRRGLGWRPRVDFREGLDRTIRWYLENREWVERVRSGEYRQWIERNYGAR